MTATTYTNDDGATIYTITHRGADQNAMGEPCTTVNELHELINALEHQRCLVPGEADALRAEAGALAGDDRITATITARDSETTTEIPGSVDADIYSGDVHVGDVSLILVDGRLSIWGDCPAAWASSELIAWMDATDVVAAAITEAVLGGAA